MSGYSTTPNLGLKKPITGADDDLWGTHWNDNADLIDLTVGALVSPPVTSVAGKTGVVTLVHTDITDWTAALDPYALSTAVATETTRAMTAEGLLAPKASPTFTSGMQLDGLVQTNRGLQWLTSASARWGLICNATAEAPSSNNGSDFQLNSYHDGGGFYATPITIKRSTSVVTFAAPIVNGSDQRLKENVATIAGALAIVNGLRGVGYTLKGGDGTRQIGLIAQEARAVLPEVVFETASGDEQLAALNIPREAADPLLGVAYGNVVAVLVEAIKELATRLDALMSKEAGV
jgi:hypothetical protein